jgi:hypothetical protein
MRNFLKNILRRVSGVGGYAVVNPAAYGAMQSMLAETKGGVPQIRQLVGETLSHMGVLRKEIADAASVANSIWLTICRGVSLNGSPKAARCRAGAAHRLPAALKSSFPFAAARPCPKSIEKPGATHNQRLLLPETSVRVTRLFPKCAKRKVRWRRQHV